MSVFLEKFRNLFSARLIALPSMILLLFAIFAYVEPAMGSAENLMNILDQASLLFMAACAQLLVLVARGFDLSIGVNISIVSVASSMVMVFLNPMLGPVPAVIGGVAAGLAIGATIGAANGFLVSFLKINPFVVTLGTMSIVGGLATTMSGGFPIFGVPTEFSYAFNQATWLLLPAPATLALILACIVHLALSRTVHGRILYLLGDSTEATLVAGRNAPIHLFFAYLSCGTIAAATGLMMTAQTGSGEPNLGTSLVLNSIAAAVVGGASLRGGVGGVAAPLLGATLVTVLSVGMNLTKVDGSLQPVIVGLVVIVATFANSSIKLSSIKLPFLRKNPGNRIGNRQ